MLMREVLSSSSSPPPPPAAAAAAIAGEAGAPSPSPLATQRKRRKPTSLPSEPTAPHKKLRSLVVARSDEPVTIAPLDQRVFVSWAAFDAHFDAYCARTFQVYRSNSSIPVTSRNAHTLERLANKGGVNHYQAYKLIPDEMETYSRLLVCTHAGQPRRRDEGKRTHSIVRALGCPAKLNLVVRRVNGTIDGPWRVHVTDHVSVHNHEVSEAQFKRYPQQRRVTDPDVLRTVRAMRKYGTPRRGIFEYIKDTTGIEAITMKDVDNLLAKMKAEDEKEEQMRAHADVQQGQDESHEAVAEA